MEASKTFVRHISKGRRRVIVIALGSVVVLGAFFLLSAVQAAKRMARWDAAQNNIRTLALAIEFYRDEHQDYPRSMEKLLSAADSMLRDRIDRDIVRNPFKDQFAFATSSNGFVITVTSRAWCMEPKTIEKPYAVGEALK